MSTLSASSWHLPAWLERTVRLAAPRPGPRAEQVIGFLPYRGSRVAYAVTGTGPPLLLDTGRIHHLEVFWRQAPYRHLVQRLSERFTVMRWDRPGFGLSDRHPPDLSPRAELGLVERLVTFLGAGRVAIVAAGDAGPTMVRFAARRPERVSHLVVFGAGLAGSRPVPGPDAALAELAGASAAAIHLVLAAAQAAGSEPAVGAWLASAFQASAGVPAMVELVRAAAAGDLAPDAALVRAPTMVVHRSGDVVVDPRSGRALASSIPGAKFVALEGRPHLIYAGDTSSVLSALLPFLTGDAEGPARLSARECDVARMVALGLANAEIARRLAIRRRTVEAHLEHIRAKLGVRSRVQIAAWFAGSHPPDRDA